MKKNTLIPLLLLGGAFVASPMAANGQSLPVAVKMTTSAPKGSTLTFIVNQTYKGFAVDWGDGQQVQYKQTDDALRTITGEVKGAGITIYGSDKWSTLICSDCSLTTLDLSGAKVLKSLYCQNNQLETISLKGMANLTDFDASNNKLSSIEYTISVNPAFDLKKIENYNVSGNLLGSQNGTFQFGTSGSPATSLSFIDISDNKYTKATLYANNAIYANAAGNALENADFSSCGKIESLVLDGNDIQLNDQYKYNFRLPSSSSLQQIILDGNKGIDFLELAKYSSLTDISLNDCGISRLTLPEDVTYTVFDVKGNNLGFEILPDSKHTPKYIQYSRSGKLGLDKIPGVMKADDGKVYIPICPSYSDRNNSLYQINLSNLRFNNGITQIVWYSVADDGTETELKGGNGKDFFTSQGKYSFFKPFKKVYARLTITRGAYKGFTYDTSTIGVGEDNATTGINDVYGDASAHGVNVEVVDGAIVLTSQSAVSLNVYSADGKTVWSGTVNSTPTTVNLPSGVYVVAGKKVAL